MVVTAWLASGASTERIREVGTANLVGVFRVVRETTEDRLWATQNTDIVRLTLIDATANQGERFERVRLQQRA